MLEALERASRSGPEDRVTEVFAYVLAAAPELATWLVRSAEGAPEPQVDDGFRVFTQGAMSGEGRPDLLLRYLSQTGRECLVLSEHKLTADLTNYQEAGYPGWRPRNGLVLICLDPEKFASARVNFDAVLSWISVAERLEELGSAAAGAPWRKAAIEPQAGSQLRGLHELLTMLEQHALGGGGVDPLSDALITAYSQVDQVRSNFKAFLRLLSERDAFTRLGPDSVVSYPSDTVWSCGLKVHWPVLESIVSDYGSEVVIAPSGSYLAEEINEPVFYAGFYFAIRDRVMPELFVNDGDFAAALEQAGATSGIQNRNQGKCACVISLRELIGESDKLSDQLEVAASWAVQAFARITAIAA